MPVNKKDILIARGIVIEALPNAQFKVEIIPPVENKQLPIESTEPSSTEETSRQTPEPEVVLAYLAGKMRLHKIRVIVGDTVEMQLDPYGGKPRIIRRL